MKKNLFQTLAEANTEEEFKNFFAKRFKIKLATKFATMREKNVQIFLLRLRRF